MDQLVKDYLDSNDIAVNVENNTQDPSIPMVVFQSQTPGSDDAAVTFYGEKMEDITSDFSRLIAIKETIRKQQQDALQERRNAWIDEQMTAQQESVIKEVSPSTDLATPAG